MQFSFILFGSGVVCSIVSFLYSMFIYSHHNSCCYMVMVSLVCVLSSWCVNVVTGSYWHYNMVVLSHDGIQRVVTTIVIFPLASMLGVVVQCGTQLFGAKNLVTSRHTIIETHQTAVRSSALHRTASSHSKALPRELNHPFLRHK